LIIEVIHQATTITHPWVFISHIFIVLKLIKVFALNERTEFPVFSHAFLVSFFIIVV
jgi:hypothetical protein